MEKRNKKTPFIDSIKADIEKYADIATVSTSEAGKTLIKSLAEDVVTSVNLLCNSHTKLTLQEFVGICAGMKANKELMEVLINAETNKKDAEAYLEEELLKVPEE